MGCIGDAAAASFIMVLVYGESQWKKGAFHLYQTSILWLATRLAGCQGCCFAGVDDMALETDFRNDRRAMFVGLVMMMVRVIQRCMPDIQ